MNSTLLEFQEKQDPSHAALFKGPKIDQPFFLFQYQLMRKPEKMTINS
jgi:hypothetical protein